MGPTTWSNSLAAWCWLFFTLWRSPLTSSYDLLFPEKIMWQREWFLLTPERSLKVKNMQKQAHLLHGVKTK
jgi:hypothetical protein